MPTQIVTISFCSLIGTDIQAPQSTVSCKTLPCHRLPRPGPRSHPWAESPLRSREEGESVPTISPDFLVCID